MPFEFLYLLCNAKPRMETMLTLQPPRVSVIKEKLGQFYDGDERRLDLEQIFPYNIKANSTRHNPRERLLFDHALEAKDTRIKILDMNNLFKEMQSRGKSSELENDTIKARNRERQKRDQQAAAELLRETSGASREYTRMMGQKHTSELEAKKIIMGVKPRSKSII